MITTSRFLHRNRGLLYLGICLLILAALPARLANAALISQSVDNSLAEFTGGTFQRTALGSNRVLSPPPGPQPKVTDQAGAIQLLPIGVLKQWFDSPFLLQEKVTDVATVVLGNRIFVIGGTVSVNNVLARTAHVWSAAVDQTTGAIMAPGWQAEPDLPAVQTSIQFIAPVAARAVAAAVAVQTDAATNSGYIYVLGGNVRPSTAPDSISSFAVNIARVVNGRIDTSYAPATNGWATGPRIPSPDGNAFNQLGVQSASAVSFTTGGKTFIYLLGGLQRYREGTGGTAQTIEAGSKKAFYAQVNSNGQLSKPSGGTGTDPVWATLSDIPIPSSLGLFGGLWDATAVAGHFENGSSGGGGDVLYVGGGQLLSASSGQIPPANDYNNAVYRALIGSNGTLTWTSAAGPNQWEGTFPEARTGMASVQFRGKLYVTGGRPVSNNTPQQPQPAVQTSYVEDDLTLPVIGDGGSNFLRSVDALPRPRARHGSVVVPATPTVEEPAAAFVYVIAGAGDSTDAFPDDNDGSVSVIYGKIGGNEDTVQTGFAASGWYYSKPHDTVFDGAQVQEIHWTTVITRPGPAMDVQMNYRTSTASNCDDPNAFNGRNWQTLDGTPSDGTATYSANSANSFAVPTGTAANCFQYRARLTSSGTPATTTPSLLNVSIVVLVPGNPDLKVQTLKDTRNLAGKFTGLNIVIQNQSTPPPTQPADIEGGGSFFVDLFVFGPGQTPVTPTLPLGSNPPGNVACVNINKNQMPAEGMLSILQWYDTADQTCSLQPKAYQTIFSTPGHYVVIVAVDTACPERSYGCVNEGSTGGENNNLKRLEFNIQGGVGIPDIYVPILRRAPAP